MENPIPDSAEIEKRNNYVAGAVAEFMSMSPCIAFMCSRFITGELPQYEAETMWPTHYMYWFYTRPEIRECLNDPNLQHIREIIEHKIKLMEQGDKDANINTAIYAMSNAAITEDDLVGSLSGVTISGGGFGR